jgi:hypothetical protein
MGVVTRDKVMGVVTEGGESIVTGPGEGKGV